MTSGLGGLSASELRTLAMALRSGKLAALFSTAVLNRLLGKCIVIDEELFVTSANFTDAAHFRNVELGLPVRSVMLARQTVSFFDRLIRSGYCVRVNV